MVSYFDWDWIAICSHRRIFEGIPSQEKEEMTWEKIVDSYGFLLTITWTVCLLALWKVIDIILWMVR